jgi:hypothetical protein
MLYTFRYMFECYVYNTHDVHMFAYILIRVSGCLSNILARTHAYIHTRVGREDRLDGGREEQGSGSSADEGD